MCYDLKIYSGTDIKCFDCVMDLLLYFKDIILEKDCHIISKDNCLCVIDIRETLLQNNIPSKNIFYNAHTNTYIIYMKPVFCDICKKEINFFETNKCCSKEYYTTDFNYNVPKYKL